MLTVLWALGVTGCGYHFMVGEAKLPDGSRRVCIPMAQNRTSDTVLGYWLTQALRKQAVQSGLEVVDLVEDTARLGAELLSVYANPRGVSVNAGRFRSQEQEVVVKVSLVLHMASGRQLQFTLEERESYLSAPDLMGTDTNRMIAIQRSMQRVAETGMERIASVF